GDAQEGVGRPADRPVPPPEIQEADSHRFAFGARAPLPRSAPRMNRSDLSSRMNVSSFFREASFSQNIMIPRWKTQKAERTIESSPRDGNSPRSRASSRTRPTNSR